MEEKLKEKKRNNIEDIKSVFDKQIELVKLKQKKTPSWKIILYIYVGIASTAFLTFSCFMMYKQSFTMETLLAVILSFFSITLSIMFYIQSEKSSSQYYMRSYEIMKEVSVALGKIEAGFGEKLTEIQSKIGNIETVKREIADKQEDENQIKEKIKKASNDKEKDELLLNLQERTREITELRNYLMHLENSKKQILDENAFMKQKMMNQEAMIQNFNDKMNIIDPYIRYSNKNDKKYFKMNQ